MTKLLHKEMKLAASPLTYWFILSSFLTLVPGYPILVGTFFLTLGIFYSFQTARESSDTLYSALLPIAKADVVKAKYLFVMVIEGAGFALDAILTLLRMTVFRNASAYTGNALMNANPLFLGFALVILGLFNLVFVRGYYKTAYKFTKPFIGYIIASFIAITIAESLHFFPGMEAVNAFGFDHPEVQLPALAAGAVLYAATTYLGVKASTESFEKIDL